MWYQQTVCNTVYRRLNAMSFQVNYWIQYSAFSCIRVSANKTEFVLKCTALALVQHETSNYGK